MLVYTMFVLKGEKMKVVKELFLGIGFLIPLLTYAQSYVSGEFIARITESAGQIVIGAYQGIATTGVPSIDSLSSQYGVIYIEEIVKSPVTPDPRLYLFRLADTTANVPVICEVYESDPYIDFAEPNYIGEYHEFIIPNDPYFDLQWWLHNVGQSEGLPDADIDAPHAWYVEKGDSIVILSPLDSGIDWDHEDLVDKVWQNLGEDADGDGHIIEYIGGQWVYDPGDINDIDDDFNGYIDDFIGWDFYDQDNDPSNESPYHGTSVSGIAGAATNNLTGVAGVGWKIPIMMCKLGPTIPENCLIEALHYAPNNDAKVITMSFGVPESEGVKRALWYAHVWKHSFLCAATGNNGSNWQTSFPAKCDSVVGVGATNHSDYRAWFSNGGNTSSNPNDIPSIELVAPGYEVYTTYANNQYTYFGGTSASSPVVAGVAALVFSKYPQWRDYPDSVRNWLNLTADKVHPWYETVQDTLFYYYDEPIAHPGWNHLMGYGRVNIYDALILDPNPVLNAGYEENNQLSDFYRWEEEYSPHSTIWVEKSGPIDPDNVHSGLYSVGMKNVGYGEVTLTQRVATRPGTDYGVKVFMKPYRLEGPSTQDGAVIFVNGEPISVPVIGTSHDFIEVEAHFNSANPFIYLGVGLTHRTRGIVYIDDISVTEIGGECAASKEIYSNKSVRIQTGALPNPFSSEVMIEYALSDAGDVMVEVYNSLGQKVRQLQSGIQPKGTHRLSWDGKDDSGRLLPSGIYFYRIDTQHSCVTQKLMLLR